MKIKTSELIGAALDWAVAKCEGEPIRLDPMGNMGSKTPRYWIWDEAKPLGHRRYLGIGGTYSPSANWALAGPIIERERISVEHSHEGDWHATFGCTPHDFLMWDQPYGSDASYAEGTTPLIAAMRCYVASKRGDEVDVPEELI